MEKKEKKGGYQRPHIGDLKKEIRELKENLDKAMSENIKLSSENSRLQAKLSHFESQAQGHGEIIADQAAHIKDLNARLANAEYLHKEAADENARLHRRTFWQRVFNILPKQ